MRKILILTLIMLSFCVQAVSAMPFFEKKENIVLITYHKISENAEEQGEFCVSPDVFENDIKYLKDKGYKFWTVSQLAVSNTVGQKVAVITFDDGYVSDYEYAVPVLEKYDACGTFFVIGSKVDTDGYLTKQQLAEMSRKDCVEIGNHSYEMHDYSFNTLEFMHSDLKCHKKIIDDYRKNDMFLQSVTGKKPMVVSYPNGIYSKETDSCLKAEGKLISVTTVEIPFKLSDIGAPLGRKNRSMKRTVEQIVR